MINLGDGAGNEVRKVDNTWRGSFLDIVPRREAPEGISETPFSCVRDGLTIRGIEFRPENGENLPIAVVCHGIMAWLDSVRHYAVELAILGYASYCFDFNGGSLMKNISDGKTEDMSVLTEMADLESVLDYTRSLPYVNPDHIFLVGCSQGGFVAAMVASKNKYPVKKLCLFYPALCIPSDVRAGKIMTKRFDIDNIPDTINCGKMIIGRKYIDDARGIDAYEEIGKYNGRVLIIHGTSDQIVNCAHSMRGVDAYLKTKPEGMTDDERAKMILVSGGTHMFLKEHDLVALKYFDEFASLAQPADATEMVEQCRIRVMTADDYDSVVKLWKTIHGFGIRSIDDSKEGVERFLLRNPNTSIVAERDGEIVGSILCGHDGRQACFYHVCVKEDMRRHGIGKAMAIAAMEALKKEHINKITLIAFKSNEIGNSFWPKVNWKLRDDINTYEFIINEDNSTTFNR